MSLTPDEIQVLRGDVVARRKFALKLLDSFEEQSGLDAVGCEATLERMFGPAGGAEKLMACLDGTDLQGSALVGLLDAIVTEYLDEVAQGQLQVPSKVVPGTSTGILVRTSGKLVFVEMLEGEKLVVVKERIRQQLGVLGSFALIAGGRMLEDEEELSVGGEPYVLRQLDSMSVRERQHAAFQAFIQTHRGFPRLFTVAEVARLNMDRDPDDQLELLPHGLLRYHCCYPGCPEFLRDLRTEKDLDISKLGNVSEPPRRNGLWQHLSPKTWYYARRSDAFLVPRVHRVARAVMDESSTLPEFVDVTMRRLEEELRGRPSYAEIKEPWLKDCVTALYGEYLGIMGV